MAGISETDPGDQTNPPKWHEPRNTAIQQINDALQEAGKNWQPNHQRQVADLVASGITAWAKAATKRQRAQNPEDILQPPSPAGPPKPALFHRTILADPWQLSSYTRRIAQHLQENDPRYAIYALMALHTRVHKSIRKETTDLERWRKIDRDPGDKPVHRATTGHHRDCRVHQQPLAHRPRPADGTRPSRTGRANKRQLLAPEHQVPKRPWERSSPPSQPPPQTFPPRRLNTWPQHPGPPPSPSHNDRSRRDGRHRASRRPGGGSNQSPAATEPQRTGASLPPTPTPQALSPQYHLKHSSPEE